MRRRLKVHGTALVTVLAVVGILLPTAGLTRDFEIFIEGAPMRGGTNGMYFDDQDRLWVANVFGRSISVLDPETGEILQQLGPNEGVLFPDDLTISPADGSIFWTDPAFGLVSRLTTGGVFSLVAAGYPSANPITISDDGSLLFFAQCFLPSGGIYQVDLAGGGVITPIRTGDPDCASNGMDWLPGRLFSPRWFEERIVEVDIGTGALTDITTGWTVPAAVKLDSTGTLHSVSGATGEVIRVDMTTGDRTVLATLPTPLDNLAFDSEDRLYVSSYTDGFVVEILPDGSVRTVSPGGMIGPSGLGVIGDTLWVVEQFAVRSYDTRDGRLLGQTLDVAGFDFLPIVTGTTAVGDDLVILDAFNFELVIWDTLSQAVVLRTFFAGPVDAEPFQGDLIVTEWATGNVVRASGPDLTQRETLATLVVPAGIAADDENLYIGDSVQGKVFQVIRDGLLLDPVEEIVGGLVLPSGLELRSANNKLLIVEAGSGTLKEFHLRSGKLKTIARDLGFFQPLPQLGLPFDLVLKNVVSDSEGALYVNGDAANVVYKIRSHGNR